MIRHTLTPLPNGNFLLKMTQDGRCLQTTDVTFDDADGMAQVILREQSRDKTKDAKEIADGVAT